MYKRQKFECKSIESIILAVEKMREKPLDREKIKELYEMKYSENANYKMLNDLDVDVYKRQVSCIYLSWTEEKYLGGKSKICIGRTQRAG